MAELNLTPEEIRGLSPEVRKKLGVKASEIPEHTILVNSTETVRPVADNLNMDAGGSQPEVKVSAQTQKDILSAPEGVDSALRQAMSESGEHQKVLQKWVNTLAGNEKLDVNNAADFTAHLLDETYKKNNAQNS